MSAVLEFKTPPVVLDPPMRTWSITYVDREKPKRKVTIEVENQYLSYACNEALAQAQIELGTYAVVMKQDHPFYKNKKRK